MAVEIIEMGGHVYISSPKGGKRSYPKNEVHYSESGTTAINLILPWNEERGKINLSDLTLGGSTPTDQENLRELWATVFSEPGGSGLPTEGLPLEIAATFAAIDGASDARFIIVTNDETNNNDKSLYLHDGSTKLFLQTIA